MGAEAVVFVGYSSASLPESYRMFSRAN